MKNMVRTVITALVLAGMVGLATGVVLYRNIAIDNASRINIDTLDLNGGDGDSGKGSGTGGFTGDNPSGYQMFRGTTKTQGI